MREKIKKEILENVTKINTESVKFTSVLEYRHLVKNNIWSDAIQAAIDEKKSVFIPDIGEDIILDSPIVLDSGCNLKADKNQKFRILPQNGICMVRNRNIAAGNHKYTEQSNPDEYITVSGGIWSTGYNRDCKNDRFGTLQGSWDVFEFSNVNHLNVTDASFTESASFAIQIGNCTGFYIDNIFYKNHHADGVHVNEPSKYGIIRNLSGKDLGDDLVALNA